MTKPRRKKISRQGVLGQRGVNLIERVVLDMGSRWTPSGQNEVGIDGYIELFTPNSGEALGKTIAVQSKAVSKFRNNTNSGFDYWCTERDLDYWLEGNMPIILVVSCPAQDEIYWVSVKDYFSESQRRQTNKIAFDKRRNRFSRDSFEELYEIGRPGDGLYLPPMPKEETVISNLLPLEGYPQKIHVAPTDLKKPKEVWSHLRAKGGEFDAAWVLQSGTIRSFHDLRTEPWSSICDANASDTIDTSEWSESDEPQRQRSFVELLNRTLQRQLEPEVRFWPREECYAFVGELEQGTKKRSYRSVKRKSKIAVVSKYERRTPEGDFYEWLRHLAFRGHFRRWEGTWHLEITPTYRFTYDGFGIDRFHVERLKGIKRQEGNRAVLSAVMLWADVLGPSATLFDEPMQLRFGNLLRFDMPFSIPDNLWASESPAKEKHSASEVDQASLFL